MAFRKKFTASRNFNIFTEVVSMRNFSITTNLFGNMTKKGGGYVRVFVGNSVIEKVLLLS